MSGRRRSRIGRKSGQGRGSEKASEVDKTDVRVYAWKRRLSTRKKWGEIPHAKKKKMHETCAVKTRKATADERSRANGEKKERSIEKKTSTEQPACRNPLVQLLLLLHLLFPFWGRINATHSPIFPCRSTQGMLLVLCYVQKGDVCDNRTGVSCGEGRQLQAGKQRAKRGHASAGSFPPPT